MMNLSLLGISFVEILKNEWLGLIASVIILISFLTSNQVKTRIINSVGCVVFVVYGFLLPTYSTAFMNLAMLVVHAVFLTKYLIKNRKRKKSEEEENDELKDVSIDNAESEKMTIADKEYLSAFPVIDAEYDKSEE